MYKYILSKKVPGIDHSKSPLKEIVKNIFDSKLAPLSSILTWSSRAICHLVCSQFLMSVYLKCVSRLSQWIEISNRVCLKFCIANGISWAESLKMLQKAYGESNLSKTCTVRSKAIEMWWNICLALVVHQRLQLKLTVLSTWNSRQKVRRRVKNIIWALWSA